MAQTTFDVNRKHGYAGMIVDTLNEDGNVVTRVANETIGFGLLVSHVAGQPDEVVGLPASADDINLRAQGFSVQDTARESNIINAIDSGFESGDCLGVFPKQEGQIMVITEDASTIGGDVFIRFQNDDPTNVDPALRTWKGGVRSDAGGGDAVQLVGWEFGRTLTARGLTYVRMSRKA